MLITVTTDIIASRPPTAGLRLRHQRHEQDGAFHVRQIPVQFPARTTPRANGAGSVPLDRLVLGCPPVRHHLPPTATLQAHDPEIVDPRRHGKRPDLKRSSSPIRRLHRQERQQPADQVSEFDTQDGFWPAIADVAGQLLLVTNRSRWSDWLDRAFMPS
jgi:hypothetical protein